MNDLKKMKQYETGNYVKLIEEKDHEYKEELKNFVKKIKSHMNENNVSTSPRDNRSVEDLSRKIREIEKVSVARVKFSACLMRFLLCNAVHTAKLINLKAPFTLLRFLPKHGGKAPFL